MTYGHKFHRHKKIMKKCCRQFSAHKLETQRKGPNLERYKLTKFNWEKVDSSVAVKDMEFTVKNSPKKKPQNFKPRCLH